MIHRRKVKELQVVINEASARIKRGEGLNKVLREYNLTPQTYYRWTHKQEVKTALDTTKQAIARSEQHTPLGKPGLYVLSKYELTERILAAVNKAVTEELNNLIEVPIDIKH